MKEKNNSREKTGVVPTKRGDIIALILSVIVAVVVWAYVMSIESPMSEMVYKGVHVEVNNTDKLNSSAGLSVLSESENINVSFTLQGKKTVLSDIKPSDIRAFVDVSSVKEAGSYDLEIACLPIPGATVVAISPSTVKVDIDSTGKISVPVEVKLSGSNLPGGYTLGETTLSVSQVEVSGAKGDLDKIGGAVITIDTSSLTSSVTAVNRVPVLVDKNGNEFSSQYITYPKTYVDVFVPVFLTKDVALEVNTLYGLYSEKNTKINITPSKITVKGEAGVVSSMPDTLIIGTIDEKKAEDTYSFAISLGEYGKDVAVLGEDTLASVSITHFKLVQTVCNIPSDKIIINNPSGASLSFDESFVGSSITLRVTSDRVGALNSDNIELIADASSIDGTQPGEFTVPLRVVFKNDLKDKAIEIGSYTVSLTVSDASQIDG